MIPFEEAKRLLKEHLGEVSDLLLPTLGGQSEIRVYLGGDNIFFRNSMDNVHEITKKKWDAVYQRRKELPVDEKNKTSRYGKPIWDSMPKDILNHITAPYIPAIMRFLETPQNYQEEKITVNPKDSSQKNITKLFPDITDRLITAIKKSLQK